MAVPTARRRPSRPASAEMNTMAHSGRIGTYRVLRHMAKPSVPTGYFGESEVGMPTAKTRKATTTKSGTPTAKAAKSGTGSQKRQGGAEEHHPRDLTVTIPVGKAAEKVTQLVSAPVGAARKAVPAKGGLPMYAGLGALGIAGVLQWPVAAGIGVGYAVLRRTGMLDDPPEQAKTA